MKLTPEREKELRDWASQPADFPSEVIHELLDEIDALREERDAARNLEIEMTGTAARAQIEIIKQRDRLIAENALLQTKVNSMVGVEEKFALEIIRLQEMAFEGPVPMMTEEIARLRADHKLQANIIQELAGVILEMKKAEIKEKVYILENKIKGHV